MSNSLTERRAERLLAESDSLKVPVAVEKVARHLGLIVQARPLGDASGVLVVESGRGMIGYNANHSQVRQRFTIAHEVGHFVLHAAGQQQRLFVDKSVFRRDQASSKGDDREEIEANQFAAALLMQLALHELPANIRKARIEQLKVGSGCGQALTCGRQHPAPGVAVGDDLRLGAGQAVLLARLGAAPFGPGAPAGVGRLGAFGRGTLSPWAVLQAQSPRHRPSVSIPSRPGPDSSCAAGS